MRKQWLAVSVWMVVATLVQIGSADDLPFDVVFAVVASAALALFLLPFGLLPFVVMLFFERALTHFPMTLDPSNWYAGRSMVVLLVLLAVAVYVFHTALAGRSAFGAVPIEG